MVCISIIENTPKACVSDGYLKNFFNFSEEYSICVKFSALKEKKMQEKEQHDNISILNFNKSYEK